MDAAQREEHNSALLKNHGFKRSKSAPVAFVREARVVSGVVHGDDFVWEGRDEDLDWVLKVLQDKYEPKKPRQIGVRPQMT